MKRTCSNCKRPLAVNVLYLRFVESCTFVFCEFVACSQWHKISEIYPVDAMVKAS